MTINRKDYSLKYNLRTMFVFEEISGKAFEIKTMLDTYILCYCCIISHDNQSLEFDEFIDYCDNHPEVMEEFNEFMTQEMKSRELMGKKKVNQDSQEKN